MSSKTRFLFLLLCAIVLLLIPIKRPFFFYDEGFAVLNGSRILSGEIPYKDFWALYPPGQSYALAGIFSLFGKSLLVERLYDLAVRLIIALAIRAIAIRITTKQLADYAFVASAALLAVTGFYAYAVFPALALDLLALLSLLDFLRAQNKQRLVLSGFLAGIAAFFRWDIALYAVVSITGTLILFRMSANHSSKPLAQSVRKVILDLVLFCTPFFTVVLVCYGLVAAQSGLAPMWQQAFVTPTTFIHQYRHKPFPPLFYPYTILTNYPNHSYTKKVYEFLKWANFYFPLFVYALALGALGITWLKKRKETLPQFFGHFSVAVFGLLLVSQMLSRFDFIHTFPAALILCLVIVSLHSPVIFNRDKRIQKGGFALLLSAYTLFFVVIPFALLTPLIIKHPPTGCYAHIPRAGCVAIDTNQENAVRFIQEHTPENELIFVGNQRHDLVFISDAGFYFLANRKSATRYGDLFPGLTTSLPVQQEIARDIETKAVHWIVLVDIPPSSEPNKSSISSGVHFLDDFISRNFTLAAEFGKYRIMNRNTETSAQQQERSISGKTDLFRKRIAALDHMSASR